MNVKTHCRKLIGPALAMLLVSGCASYCVIVNDAMPAPKPPQEYSVRSHTVTGKSSDISLTLTFSGGGTRAATLAYGVMLELRDTQVMVDGESTRLPDEIDIISSVSGGSFTAAYYGLHGDGLFDTFEDVFLRYDIEKQLVGQVLNPIPTKPRGNISISWMAASPTTWACAPCTTSLRPRAAPRCS